ncbi:MAG: DUF2141 domain-containing protein [Gloeocapsa sp. DLM2.Bin57]|nr:MAG: DUF2141 domain-containing protein [Gloeocapsa sp. DLM2.Bin57]
MVTNILTVEVSGFRKIKGNLCVALFDNPDSYNDKSNLQPIRSSCLLLVDDPQNLTFSELPYGSYAIAVFHDENEDFQLNTNFLGIPKEGMGFSNNPSIWKGGPDYEAMKFDFTPEQSTIAIKIKYLI